MIATRPTRSHVQEYEQYASTRSQSAGQSQAPPPGSNSAYSTAGEARARRSCGGAVVARLVGVKTVEMSGSMYWHGRPLEDVHAEVDRVLNLSTTGAERPTRVAEIARPCADDSTAQVRRVPMPGTVSDAPRPPVPSSFAVVGSSAVGTPWNPWSPVPEPRHPARQMLCAMVQSGVALTDLSPLRLQQLQDSWRSRRRLSEPTVASFNSSTARKEQVQRDMVQQFIAEQVGLTDLNPHQLQTMASIWDAKKGC